ncbi:Ada metal-binding domain-containing protein [Mucilaginibacter celer]|uniref:Metal-binding protein n=1 Tax=Mucilaginibacter celer TaxID=2305508 RepID=A0A494VHA7_9SPHI|nr:Ada metal-binding domain-containing protein [Mucilaginibacter celer]AYL94057.1 metal-binding protein [Mucilaginibacter celer]
MIRHLDLGTSGFERSRKLKQLIDAGEVRFGGFVKLKIYGLLKCPAGKRMKVENRVFFASEDEALRAGYRPCGRCMKEDYLKWKTSLK